jgi:MFS family permease
VIGLTDTPRAKVLLVSSLIARLPLAMLSISLLVNVHRLTGSFAIAGAASGTYVIGRGLTAPLLGRLVDRHGQTLVLMGCATTSAALLVAVALLPATAPNLLVVGLCGAIGTVSPPLAACTRALLPVIVTDPNALDAAYTLETTALELTFIAGPPLALGLATSLSTRAPLLAGATILLTATGAFTAQPASRHRHGRGQPGRAAGALHSPTIRTLALILVAVGIVFGAVDVAVAASASSQHAIGATGPLLGIWGVGSLLGGIIATRTRTRTHTHANTHHAGAVIVLITALAAGHAALIIASANLPLLGGLLLLAGASISPATGAIYALAGRAARPGTKTEAFSWLLSANATGASIGAAAAGTLSQTAGPQAAFALAAGAGGLAVLIAILGRTAWSLPTRDPVATAGWGSGQATGPEVLAEG